MAATTVDPARFVNQDFAHIKVMKVQRSSSSRKGSDGWYLNVLWQPTFNLSLNDGTLKPRYKKFDYRTRKDFRELKGVQEWLEEQNRKWSLMESLIEEGGVADDGSEGMADGPAAVGFADAEEAPAKKKPRRSTADKKSDGTHIGIQTYVNEENFEEVTKVSAALAYVSKNFSKYKDLVWDDVDDDEPADKKVSHAQLIGYFKQAEILNMFFDTVLGIYNRRTQKRYTQFIQ